MLSIDFENKEVEEEKIKFGSENGAREFKCSIVYPAEAQWQPDVDKQVGVILKTICGFLNGAGGVLYIGVILVFLTGLKTIWITCGATRINTSCSCARRSPRISGET